MEITKPPRSRRHRLLVTTLSGTRDIINIKNARRAMPILKNRYEAFAPNDVLHCNGAVFGFAFV